MPKSIFIINTLHILHMIQSECKNFSSERPCSEGQVKGFILWGLILG